MTLTEKQRSLIGDLCALGLGGQSFLPATLLTGPRGSGKRTIARAAAEELGMEFVELPLEGSAVATLERLRGTAKEAEAAANEADPPGDLGRSTPTLLYLSGLESIEADLFQPLHRALSVREYVDASGGSWRLSDDLWIVCGLTFPTSNRPSVGPEHRLITAFQARMRIEAPSTEAELVAVCESVLAEYPTAPHLDPAIGTALATAVGGQDYLHAVRRWTEWMVNHCTGEQISVETLQAAIAEDLSCILPRIQYRGCTLSHQAFQVWASQFPGDIRAVPVHIVREIADRYYIGTTRYFEALDDLIAQSGVSRKDSVAFCNWQCLGRSASRVAHDLKNQGRWRATSEIDLDADEDHWPDFSIRGGCPWVIVADDFVGSGRTVSKLFKSPSPIQRLLAKYPRIKIRILLVAGFETGLRQVQAVLAPYGDRVQLIASRIFRDEDRCFVPGSRIFSDAGHRERVRLFCVETAERHYPGLPSGMRLGHSEIGALAVFFDTVPNNSLPILWHDEGTWRPLFPASGLPAAQ